MVPMDNSSQAIPCGKIARSFFTDTFVLKKNKSEGEDEKQITINEKGIAWH